MELVYEILRYVVSVIVIIVVLAIIVYFLLPFFFGKVWNYDATYKYSKDDFDVKKTTSITCSEQNNEPQLKIDPKTGIYSIEFGEKRKLVNGIVKIHVQKKWYSSSPKEKDQPLILKEFLESKGMMI
ncbi:MAG: hypothetical protein ACTSRG_08710 [Candidatus Helarchaeota archaeon]